MLGEYSHLVAAVDKTSVSLHSDLLIFSAALVQQSCDGGHNGGAFNLKISS